MVDVGQALEKIFYNDNTASQTFELYGPTNYSTAEISELVDREIFKKRKNVNIPKAIFKPVAGILNRALWWPMFSADEVEREFHDQVIDESAKTFKDLGIEPGEIKDYIYHYLVCFALSWTIKSSACANTRGPNKLAFSLLVIQHMDVFLLFPLLLLGRWRHVVDC